MVPSAVISAVASTATIAVSAVAGAICVTVFRGLHRRRRLLSALHAELVDNYLKIESTIREMEEDNEAKHSYPAGGLSTAAYQSIKTGDPILYARIDGGDGGLTPVYSIIYDFNRAFSSNPISTVTVSVDTHLQEQDEQEDNQEVILSSLNDLQDRTEETIEAIEQYPEHTYFGKLLYRGIFHWSPTDLHVTSEDDD